MASFNAKVVFVNPFYQEGVGRRTGILMKQNIRKHSDGFEIFDDYWTDTSCEGDSTLNATIATEKENNRGAANQKETKQVPARKKSSLAPMPSFSPQVTSSKSEESLVVGCDVDNASPVAANASTNDAGITGSVIKGPANSLEPSSAICKFKTKQRLSFSAKSGDDASEAEEGTAQEENGTTTEEDGKSIDYDTSQESSASSEGMVKAPSSQSEGSVSDGEDVQEGRDNDEEKGSDGTTKENPDSEDAMHTLPQNDKVEISGPVADQEPSSAGETVSSSQDVAAENKSRTRTTARRSLRNVSQKEPSQGASSASHSAEGDEPAQSSSEDRNVGEAGRRKSKTESTRGKRKEEDNAINQKEEIISQSSQQGDLGEEEDHALSSVQYKNEAGRRKSKRGTVRGKGKEEISTANQKQDTNPEPPQEETLVGADHEERAQSSIQEKSATESRQRRSKRLSVRRNAEGKVASQKKAANLEPSKQEDLDVADSEEHAQSSGQDKNVSEERQRKSKGRPSERGRRQEGKDVVRQNQETNPEPSERRQPEGRKSSQTSSNVKRDGEDPGENLPKRRSSRVGRKSELKGGDSAAEMNRQEQEKGELNQQASEEDNEVVNVRETKTVAETEDTQESDVNSLAETIGEERDEVRGAEGESNEADKLTIPGPEDTGHEDNEKRENREPKDEATEADKSTNAGHEDMKVNESEKRDDTGSESNKALGAGCDDATFDDLDLKVKETKKDDGLKDDTGDDDFFLSLRTTKLIPKHVDLEPEDADSFHICDVDSQGWGADATVEESATVGGQPQKKKGKSPGSKEDYKTDKRKSARGKAHNAVPAELVDEEKSSRKMKGNESKKTKGKNNRAKTRFSKYYSSRVETTKQLHQKTLSKGRAPLDRDSGVISKETKIVRKRKASQNEEQNSLSLSPEETKSPRLSKGSRSCSSQSEENEIEETIPCSQRKRETTNVSEKKEALEIRASTNFDVPSRGEAEYPMPELKSEAANQETGNESAVAVPSSRRMSSVHFTTKDMISAEGDISVHRVESSEDDDKEHRRALPTPAVVTNLKGRPSCQKPQRGGARRKGGMNKRGSLINRMSETEVEYELDQEEISEEGGKGLADQRKQSKKRTSPKAVFNLSVTEDDSGPSGARKSKRRKGGRISSSSESDQASGDKMRDHSDKIVTDFLDDYDSGTAFDDASRQLAPTPTTSTTSGSYRERLSSSTGSILKTGKNWTQRAGGKKNYSLLFTENPTAKAYIIKPEEKDGVRRTRRNRIRPLEYWRNERAVYERRKSGGFALSGVHSPEESDKAKQKRSSGERKTGKVKGQLSETPSNISVHQSPPPGSMPVTQSSIAVVNPETDQEVIIDAITSSKMLRFIGPAGQPAQPNDPITISKAFSQRAFSAGILTVRPLEEKGSQLVRRDTMVFFVVRGKIVLTLHQTSRILENGDWFFVPKGNVYNIKNLRKDVAKLAFFQLKGE